MNDSDDTLILPQQREAAATDSETRDGLEQPDLERLQGDDGGAPPGEPETAKAPDTGRAPYSAPAEGEADPPGGGGDRSPEDGDVRLAEEPDAQFSETAEPPRSIDEPTQMLSLEAIRAAEQETNSDSIVASAPVTGQHRARERALAQLGWLASALLMAGVGLLRIDRAGLGQDEAITWGMARAPWTEFEALLRAGEVVGAPYYLLMRAVTDVAGSADVVLRLPSLLAMVAAAAMVAVIGSRLASPRVGLLAGTVFAVLPVTSRYAQEAGPYALTVFAAVLSTLALVLAYDRPKFWRWAGYALTVVLLGALHPVAVGLLVAHGFAVLVARARLFLRWLIAALIGAAPGGVAVWHAGGDLGRLSTPPKGDIHVLAAYPEQFFGVALLAGIVLALAMFAISMQQPALIYTAWALIPTAAVFVAGFYMRLWTPEYLLFTLPGWVLLAGTALGRAPLMRGVVALLAIGVLAVPAHRAMREHDGHIQDTRRLTALLAAATLPGDGIVYGPPETEGRVARNLVAHYVPEGRRPKDLLAVEPPGEEGSLLVEECEDVFKCLGKTKRIWLVRSGEPKDPIAQLGPEKARPLREFEVMKTWHPDGLTLSLLVRKPA